MKLTKKLFRNSLFLGSTLAVSMNMAWADSVTLEQRVKQLENKATIDSASDLSAKFYATVRPSLTYSDVGDENSIDVTDFLSFAGLYTEAEIGDGWTAVAHGEWGLDIAKNGDFGAARRASVGLQTPYGKVAFGKDRAIDYLLHATHVDIFNHRASPYAYDQIGKDAFFTANQVTYSNTWDSISLMAGFKFDGSDDFNYAEQSIAGLSYDANDLHLAASFKSTKSLNTESSDAVAVSYAQQITDTFYLAAVYQDEEEISTFDMSLAYKINNKYKFKGGYYSFDDGVTNTTSMKNNGFNLTLERQFTPKFRTHVELLTKSYDNSDNEIAVTVGFKYDVAILWKN